MVELDKLIRTDKLMELSIDLTRLHYESCHWRGHPMDEDEDKLFKTVLRFKEKLLNGGL